VALKNISITYCSREAYILFTGGGRDGATQTEHFVTTSQR